MIRVATRVLLPRGGGAIGKTVDPVVQVRVRGGTGVGSGGRVRKAARRAGQRDADAAIGRMARVAVWGPAVGAGGVAIG